MRRHEPFLRCWILTRPFEQTPPESSRLALGWTMFRLGLRFVLQARGFAPAVAGDAQLAARSAMHAAPAIAPVFNPMDICSAKALASLTVGLPT
jgi:hypothetical protein